MERSSGKLQKYANIISVMSLLALVFATLAFAALIVQPYDVKSDPLYVDLMDSPAYIKAGFDLSYANIQDPDEISWDHVLPAGHGAVLPANYIENGAAAKRQFLSPGTHEVAEYTILIPLEIGSETYDKLFQRPFLPLGISLAGIGDNWEVFLNGDTILSSVDLDEDGQIQSHRSQRDVTAFISRGVLTQGSNTLVFRIVGVPGGDMTGLFYASPYYIGTYSQIENHRISVTTVVFCAVYVFVGLYHLLMFLLRKQDVYNLTYAMFSLVVTVYFIARSAAIYRFFQDTAITQRIEYGSLYLLPFLLSAFIEQLNFGKMLIFSKIYGCVCVLFLILQSALSIQFANDLLRVWQICGVAVMLYILVYDVGFTFFARVREKIRSNGELRLWALIRRDVTGTPLGNILLASIFLSITTIFDVLDSVFLHTGIVLTTYSFFIFTVSAAFILAREYASSFSLVNRMNEVLETTVKERTHELEEQVVIAEKASRAKGDFLANMSHEIRTPLNAVIGMTIIGKTAPDLDKKDYCFYKIEEASAHLLGVINDVLDMSKIEADKLELSEVNYDFRATVERIAHVITFKTEEKKQTLAINIDPNIPRFLVGDDQRIAQVITNLFGNAVKFTPEGGHIGLTAALEEETDEDCVIRVEVKDSGIGISEEQQARLFTSFQQADSSTSRNYGGTGLGLTISKRIVELMAGSMWIDSKPGQGSVFSFRIRSNKGAEMEYSQSGDEEDIIPGEFAGKTALLADDVEINREIVISILEPTELSIESAENGEEAFVKFCKEPDRFDIVLMDVQMPVMDGYAATERIRALGAPNAGKIPIIAMTANVFKDDIEKSKLSGMNEHVGKPIDLTDLLRVLRKYLKAPV